MSARTQVYFSAAQRARIDRIRARDGVTMAEVVRAAVDAYLANDAPPAEDALAATFGALPRLRAPSRDEWKRG